MQRLWPEFCMTLIHKNLTTQLSRATFQLYFEVSIMVQLQNDEATGWWWDQKWWNFKFHIFWSRDQPGALLWLLLQKINFVSCFWRSQVDLDKRVVTQLPLCVENRLEEGIKKCIHFLVPSPPLFSLHKGNFEDLPATQTKPTLTFKTSWVDPRSFDHNLCERVNKLVNTNFLICSQGSSQKQYMRDWTK